MLKIRNSDLDLLAIIDDYWNDKITEVINREYTLTFDTVIDGGKSDYIQNDNIVEVDDQYFRIVYYRQQMTQDGTLIIRVEADQVGMDLNDPAYDLDTFTEDDTPTNILTSILSGTGFTVGTVDFASQTTFSIQEKSSRRAILIQFAQYINAEIKFDKFEISLLTRRGADNGVQFRAGKNIRGIVKDVDKRSGTEVVAYDVDILELRTLPEYGDLEAIELGDTVRVIGSDLGIDVSQRIVKYEYSPKLRINSRVTIANLIEGIEDTLYRIQRDTVAKNKLYYGIRIGPDQGFETIRSDGNARSIMNADEIKLQKTDGSGGWIDQIYLDGNGDAVFAGSLSAASGTFAGSLSAATGTFAGDLSAAGGTFSGALSAASGTFAGTLSAVDGTFTGTLSGVDGDFSGQITASSGSIGGWTIEADRLSGTGIIEGGEITGTTIEGGTVTGATVRTDDVGQNRVELRSVLADIAMFNGSTNNFAVLNNGSTVAMFFADNSEFNSGGGRLEMTGEYDFSTSTITGFAISDVTGLQTELNSLQSQITSNDGDISAIQSDLNDKVDESYADANYVVNGSFDTGTRNLKLFNSNGVAVATINIP